MVRLQCDGWIEPDYYLNDTLTHSIFSANPRVELVGIVDSNITGAQSLAYPLGTNAYSTLPELVEDQEVPIDGVVCCTPTMTHASIVHQAVTLGVSSGVFVEKPVGQFNFFFCFTPIVYIFPFFQSN